MSLMTEGIGDGDGAVGVETGLTHDSTRGADGAKLGGTPVSIFLAAAQ